MSAPLLASCKSSPAPGMPCPAADVAYITLDAAIDFADLGISGANIGNVVGWGFGVVIFLWFLGYCIGLALALIRKI